MNDLREVLHQHAAAVEDTHQHDRATAVHQRVQAAKRRRALTGAAVAVLVVGAVIGGLVIPQHHTVAPADRPSHMVGHAVPKTTKSWGATYSYANGYVGTGHLSVPLPKSGQDVLVRVASANESGRLSVKGSGPAWVLPAGDFGTFMKIDGGDRTVTVDARGATGDIALAVYTFSKGASGYTRDGITFPDVVAKRNLLGAFIGEPGQAHQGAVHLSRFGWTGTRPTLQIIPLCVHAPKGAMLAVDVGDGPLEIGCSAGPAPRDAGHDVSTVTVPAPQAATSASVSLVDHHGKPIAPLHATRIGAGIYGFVNDDHGRAGLMGVVDQDGHTWQLQGTVEISRDLERWRRVPADPPLVCTGRVGQSSSTSAPGCSAQPVLVAYGTTGGSKGDVEARVPGQDPARNSAVGLGYAELAMGDPDAAVSVRGTGLAPGTKLVVGTYVLAD